jgi:hypothetical protein
MENPAGQPTTDGLAFRVTILGSDTPESFLNVRAQLDKDHDVVHVFSADGQTHYMSIPTSRTLIEWKDASVLEPQIRMPTFGPNSFEQAGQQISRMMEGFGKAFPG